MGRFSRLRSARALRGLAARHDEPTSFTDGDLPTSVAIIMDGNARWAKERRLPIAVGHREGAKALKRVVRHASDLGIKDLTVFSFSTENWARPESEVQDLMALFCELIDKETTELTEENVRMRFIGRLDELPAELQERIAWSQDTTRPNTGLNLYVAMNYGSRGEIVDAARRFVATHGDQGGEAEFASCMYEDAMRDPELIIRTSGEQRLSNFLLWQGAYAELYFSDRLWPDWGPDDLEAALRHYAGCQRRFGAR
ncbi:MAG TPA: polyprenyl diphosphate synthase [Miltoncostaeales bacterium]|jgi:undecaprenyl diphosphate synthase|nr:polyprenyl diphosphate synthase [Miltoncostaeales bacterium]